MRYKDVANRLVASPALPIDKKTTFDAVSMAVVVLRAYQRARCLCQVLWLLIVNVGPGLVFPVGKPGQINVFVVVHVNATQWLVVSV